jgi:hypothetical protein
MTWKKQVARNRGMIVDKQDKTIRVKTDGDMEDHEREIEKRKAKRKERRMRQHENMKHFIG